MPETVIERDGRTVIVDDQLPPEANAMAMAMYSRSPKSFLIHLGEVLRHGWQKFIAVYYVGYGHKSIGDCGSTNIYTEYVSMLGAKAIQHYKRYKGQEASTRYLDMKSMPVLNPLKTDAGQVIQDRWMKLYAQVLDRLIPYLKERYPRLESDDPTVYEKAVKAKAFDIARAFLPAGCTTFVGWHTALREAADHLQELAFHPLLEVREVTGQMLEALREKYPSSFGFKSYPMQDAYLRECGALTYEYLRFTEFEGVSSINLEWLLMESDDKRLLKTRPEKTELPDRLNRYGTIRFRFPLDFGSFRDLQRHRSCTQMMPLLTTEHGIHPWYLDSLPEDLRHEVLCVIEVQKTAIAQIEDSHIRQYYIAMGYRVMCEMTAGLPSAIYIAELRSTQAVHPTLRPIAQAIGRFVQNLTPAVLLRIAVHCDMGPDEWSTIRGKHDIVKKDE